MHLHVDAHLEGIAPLTDVGTAEGHGKGAVAGVGEVAAPEVDIDATHVDQHVGTEGGVEVLPGRVGIVPVGASVAGL